MNFFMNKISNYTDLNFIKLCLWVKTPLVRFTSAFLNHIFKIIITCSNKEMVWIATRRIVAFMQNTKVARDGAIYDLPEKSMGLKLFIINCKFTIPTNIQSFFIGPAIFKVACIDVIKKSAYVAAITLVGIFYTKNIIAKSAGSFYRISGHVTTSISNAVKGLWQGELPGSFLFTTNNIISQEV